MITLESLIVAANRQGASDLHLEPAMPPGSAARLRVGWRRALGRSRGWEEPEK